MGTPIKSATHAPLGWLINALLTIKVNIDSTAVDATNPQGTHILRAGLILGTSTGVSPSGSALDYRTAAGAGLGDVAHFILMQDVDLKDNDAGAASTDHVGVVLVIGAVKLGACLLEDAAAIADLAKGGSGRGLIYFY